MIYKGALSAVVAVAVVSGCAVSGTGSSEWDLVERGFYNMVEQDWERAEKDFLGVLEKNPDNPYALLNLGAVYQNTGREAQAKEMYDRLLKLEPEQTAAKATYSEDVGDPLMDIAQRNLSLIKP
jgi:tetratricopeptide (TPR) repeat protein